MSFVFGCRGGEGREWEGALVKSEEVMGSEREEMGLGGGGLVCIKALIHLCELDTLQTIFGLLL